MSFFNVKKIIHMYLNSNLLYFYSWFLIHLNLYYKQYIAYDLYFYWSCYWFRLAYVMMHVILHFIVLYIFMYIKHDVSFYWYIFYFEFNLKKKIYIYAYIFQLYDYNSTELAQDIWLLWRKIINFISVMLCFYPCSIFFLVEMSSIENDKFLGSSCTSEDVSHIW